MTVETRPIQAPAEPRTKTVGDVLRNAARIIEERGHAKDTLEAEDGSVCAIGALLAADGGDPNGDWGDPSIDAYGRLSDHLGVDEIPEWNNAPERTAAEVTAALRAAADEADR